MTREDKEKIIQVALSMAKLRAGWWRAPCPFCGGKDDTLSYNPTTGYYHCFRQACRTKGVLGEVPEDLVGAGPTADEQAAEIALVQRPPEDYVPLAGDDSLIFADARKYLRQRKLPEHVWREAQVGACVSGRYAGRIVIPNLMPDGSWYGYTTRAYSKSVPKKFAYRYPPGGWRGEVMHNLPAIWQKTDEVLYVVEGAFDALALWPHAVAVLGMPSERQLQLLASATRPLCVVLDADAWEVGWSVAMKLRVMGATAGAVRLMDGLDPDEVDPSDLWEWAQSSLHVG